MVWVGTERPVAAAPCESPYRDAGPPAVAIRRRVPSQCVTYIGSHEGCGCGFNSSDVEWQGFDDEAELAPLVGALLDSEREKYLAERGSRERLHAIVASALADGSVFVHACWAGDEGKTPAEVEEVDASWLLTRTSPLKEGVQYRVTRAHP